MDFEHAVPTETPEEGVKLIEAYQSFVTEARKTGTTELHTFGSGFIAGRDYWRDQINLALQYAGVHLYELDQVLGHVMRRDEGVAEPLPTWEERVKRFPGAAAPDQLDAYRKAFGDPGEPTDGER